MKRAKLSFSNIILIIACLVVVISILYLNVINTRNIITLKASIDTLQIDHHSKDKLYKTVFKNAVNGKDAIQKLFWVSLVIILLIVAVLLFNVYKMANYENDILEAREKAVKMAQVKSRFLSNMSHEIRSPLTAIMGFTELIDKMETDHEKKNFLYAIKTSSEHLLSTVNDVLDFSKLDAGKLKLENQPFLISNAIEEVSFALASTSAAKKNISVKTNIQLDKKLTVSGDLFRLKQILYNLLSNAIKFTEKGKVTVQATLLGNTGKSVVIKIAVIDSGIGIPNDQIKTVFEEFTQVTNTNTAHETRRSIKGTGLGLSICKLLVELQGGTIAVESKLNEGSIFTFTIPYEVVPQMIEKEVEVLADKNFYTSLNKKRALVIEDNDVNIMLLTMLLKKVGIVFDIAKDGDTGFALFEANPYDIILTDINVPKLTGDELAMIIREYPDPIKSAIPIVGLTATIVQDDLDAYLVSGINEVMVKPFKQDQLYQLIEKYIG